MISYIEVSNYFKLLLRKLFQRRVTTYTSTDFSLTSINCVLNFHELVDSVSHLKGVFVEAGFGRGESFLVLTKFAVDLNKKIYGLDSFMGFPEPTSHDASSRKPKKGEWSHRSLLEAHKQVRLFGIPNEFIENNLVLLAGYVENTFRTNPISEEIALLHIDLDLYSGYQATLEYCWPKMLPGSVIMFDEYGETKWPGATKAIDDFCLEHSISLNLTQSNKYFLRVP